MQATHIQIVPRISEKAYGLSTSRNVYTFTVSPRLNKNEIAAAVSTQYGVTVTDVRTIVSKGKLKNAMRRGGRPLSVRRSDFKKAYVTLAEGDQIKVFDEEQK